MNIPHSFIVLVFLFSSSACKDEKIVKNEIIENISSDLKIDHFNIWVKNPEKAKQRLIDIGFTSVLDSFSQIHYGQGTAGRYFNFCCLSRN